MGSAIWSLQEPSRSRPKCTNKEEPVIQDRVILKPYGSAEREQRVFGHIAEVRNVQCQTEKELAEAISNADVLIADVDIQVTREALENAERLQGIMACSIGVDYIDVEAATKAGIYVANLPDYCVNAVAEFAIGLLFSLWRHIPQGVAFARDGNYQGRRLLKGVELVGKQLGLVGFGKIGQAVGEKAVGLGMNVYYYDPYLGASSPVPFCLPVSNLDQLLVNSDVVSLHTPLNDRTRNLLSYKELSSMKPTAVLINVARGGIVNEDDLHRALVEGKIAGAALDVLAVEPFAQSHPLLALDNVIITPHMAWNTVEAKEKAEHTVVEQVKQMLEGNPPTYLVNKEVVSRKKPS
jgi:D-3-phosphoglycerate dehydrogenase